MDSREFAKTIEKQVTDFCRSLDAKLPAYSYIPLTTDETRIKVMQSRLFNEIRWRIPLHAQRRAYAVIDRHLSRTRAYLESSNEATLELTGTRPTCRATTRRSGLCSHSPDPRTGYCRWHSHLVEEDEHVALVA